LKDLLTEDLIKLNLECNDWGEGIKYGTALLIEKKICEKMLGRWCK